LSPVIDHGGSKECEYGLAVDQPPVPRKASSAEFASVRDPAAFDVDWHGFYDEAEELGARVREDFPHERHVLYGTDPFQLLNIYLPNPEPGDVGSWPVFVWAHGGAFREGHPDYHDWMARPFVDRGAVFVSVGYRLQPATVHDAIADFSLALGWLGENVESRGGDPTRFIVGGHSAGAMIAASLAVRGDWQSEQRLAPDAVAGLLGVSGLYDFAELERTGVFPPAEDHYRSVDPMVVAEHCPEHVLLVYGSHELNRKGQDGRIFPASGRAFAARLAALGADIDEVELEQASHLDTAAQVGQGEPWLASFVQAYCERHAAGD
jgi:arylformamidase